MTIFDEKVSRQTIDTLEYYRQCPLEEVPIDILRLFYLEKLENGVTRNE